MGDLTLGETEGSVAKRPHHQLVATTSAVTPMFPPLHRQKIRLLELGVGVVQLSGGELGDLLTKLFRQDLRDGILQLSNAG